MRRLLKFTLVATLLLGLLFFGAVGYIWATSARPRVAQGWERLPNLPDPRGEVAAAVGTRVLDDCPQEPCSASPVRYFVIGGIKGLGSVVPTVDLYDPTTDTWARGPDLPEKRHHAAAAGWSGTMYVSGGSVKATDWTPARTLWTLNAAESEWKTAPPMPEGRMGHQLVAADRRLYVIGGRGPTANVLIFDVVGQRWTLGAEMPGKRDHLGAVLVDGSIYTIGGRDERMQRRVDVYDIATDSWRAGPPLPEPMSAMVVGATPEGIHVVGGEDPNTFSGGVLDAHYVLPTGSTRWQDGALPVVATHGAAGAVLNDRLIIAGGSRRQGSLSPLGWTGIVEAYIGSLGEEGDPEPSPSPTT